MMNVAANIDPTLPTGESRDSSVWDEPIGILAEAARSGFDGELYFTGDTFRAKVCIAAGRVAWARCSTHDEFFSTFLRQQLGISEATLQSAMTSCQTTGRRFGEELVARGVVAPERLRACLAEHVSHHLWHLAHTRGDFEVEYVDQRYRYGSDFTFTLRELLARALEPGIDRVRARSAGVPLAVVSSDHPGPLATVQAPRPDELVVAAELAARRRRYGAAIAQVETGPALFRTGAGDVFVQPLTLWSGLCAVAFGRPGTPLGSLLGVTQLLLE